MADNPRKIQVNSTKDFQEKLIRRGINPNTVTEETQETMRQLGARAAKTTREVSQQIIRRENPVLVTDIQDTTSNTLAQNKLYQDAPIGRITPERNGPSLNKESTETLPKLDTPKSAQPVSGKEALLQKAAVYGIKSIENRRKKRNPLKKINLAPLWFKLVFYGLAICVDILQVILDFFAVGVVINRIIDVIIGLLFAGIMYLKGVSVIEHYKLYGSVLVTLLGEEIPIIDALPLWTFDAYYIIKTLKADSAAHNAQVDARQKQEKQKEQRQLLLQQQQIQIEQEYPVQTDIESTPDVIGRIEPPTTSTTTRQAA